MEKPNGGIVGKGLILMGCMCRAMLVKTGVEPIAHPSPLQPARGSGQSGGRAKPKTGSLRKVPSRADDWPVKHRQTKAAATDMFDVQPPRHTSTLPKPNWADPFPDVCLGSRWAKSAGEGPQAQAERGVSRLSCLTLLSVLLCRGEMKGSAP